MKKAKGKFVSKKVFVAMSGGVDSSVAALLLKNWGYEVVGVFMRCWSDNIAAPRKRGEPRPFDNGRDGCAEKDAEDARRVAGKLGIPFYVWDFEEEYKKKVVYYMVEGYRRGLTPNPDVMCNKEIKFGLFLEKALKFGADYVATGHYVRLAKSKEQMANGKKLFAISYKLFAARDSAKDQSYFLWTLTQKQLKHCIFPIGDYQKSEVRKMAKKTGLPTAEKKDSQGICFLGKVTLADFLKNYIQAKKGAVLNIAGEIIGKHSGAHFYTIGQRHIGMADRRQTQKTNFKPLYVAKKDIEANTLVVAEGNDNPALYKKEIKINNINFINPETDSLISARGGQTRLPAEAIGEGGNERMNVKVLVRVRYRQPLAKATLSLISRKTVITKKGGLRQSAASLRESALLIFEQKQKFVAPGQSAVFYVGHLSTNLGRNSKKLQMLGGGIIM